MHGCGRPRCLARGAYPQNGRVRTAVRRSVTKLVALHQFAVLDDLVILTGAGDDLVLVDRIAVHDETRIATGSGSNCTVFGDLTPASATECPTAP